MLSKRITYIILFFSIIGLLVSGYLWYEYSKPGPLTCVTDCQIVRESKYSKMFGVDLPAFGTLYYVFIVLYTASFLLKRKVYKIETTLFSMILTSGFLFSMYLTYLEAFVIEAWCQWCVISAACATTIFLVNTFASFTSLTEELPPS